MNRRDEVTSRVLVKDRNAGKPPQVLLVQIAVRPDGKARTITQKVPVPDASLFARLCTEVCQDEEIEAIIVTKWSKSGYTTYLSGFRLLSPHEVETLAA